jgi:hypothetical protein
MVRQVLKVVLVCHLIKFIVKEKRNVEKEKSNKVGDKPPSMLY